MNKIKLSTNLHCQSCVQKIKPTFDGDTNIKEWEVSLKSDIKTLTVEGHNLSKPYIKKLLNKSGYDVLDRFIFWRDLPKWKNASFNTLSCLVGCSIGDFGMVIYLQAFHPNTSMVSQMALAIIAGLLTSILLETTILKHKEQLTWSYALKTALEMSFISMIAMEIAMTSTDFMITGGKASFNDPKYWLALLPALLVGFIVPLPYNYFRLKKFNKACH